MKLFKKLFKNDTMIDLTNRVVTKRNHNINADELAAYIRKLEIENSTLKDITNEHSTISYKLGKVIINTLNKTSSNRELLLELLNIYTESRKRKYLCLENAPFIDKLIILLTDKGLQKHSLLSNAHSLKNNNIKDIVHNDKEDTVYDEIKIESRNFSQKISNIKKAQFGPLIFKDAIELSLTYPIWYELPVKSGQTLIIKAASQYINMKDIDDRKAVLMINSYAKDGKEVDIPCGQMVKSKNLHAYFKYLPSTNNRIKELHSFVVPNGISHIRLGLSAFNTVEEQKVFVKSLSVEPKLDASQTNRSHSPDSQSVGFKVVNRSEILINNQPFIDKLSITGNKKYEIANFKISESADTLEILAVSLYQLKNNIISRKAVVLLDFLDTKNNRILDVSGIGFSTLFDQFFRYLNNNCKSIEQDLESIVKIKIPDGVVSVNLTIASMSLKADEYIDIRFQVQCYSEIEEKEAILQNLKSQPLPNPIVHDPYIKRYTSDLTIASILDEFTTECLSHEVELIKVTQEDWKSQLEQAIPDFLLVESCWRGNNGNWGTLTKGSSGGKKLSPLLHYCKKNNIPTVFWNKEDPPHYEKFGAIARLFDVAITTDINMVDRYKADFGIDVYPLSFAAQPKIHNPAPTIPRLNKAVFAGSYYRDKYKRCADFDDIMSQVKKANVDYDIFDRNYHNDIENFIYPDHYQDHIIGNLPAEDVWKAHKGYKYQVNMNTVQGSSTMFARRVYESLASGTPVISNDSVGVQQLFGDLVIMPNKKQSITQQLRDLESSHLIYEDRVRRGVRRVMREHTYGHRIQQICKLLGIDVDVAEPKAKLAITVSSEAEIARAKSMFEAQTASTKQLFIELEDFDNAHQLLNNSNSAISYAMKSGHAFYDDESQYYGSDKVLKCNVNESIPAEALEDFVYWGEFK